MDDSTRPTSQPPVNWSPPPARRSDGGFDVSDFLSFRYLITPGLITIIYVIGAIFITLAAIASVAVPQGRDGTAAGGGILGVLVILVLGNLWWRIVLEFVMVLFRINDSLASIDRRGGGM